MRASRPPQHYYQEGALPPHVGAWPLSPPPLPPPSSFGYGHPPHPPPHQPPPPPLPQYHAEGMQVHRQHYVPSLSGPHPPPSQFSYVYPSYHAPSGMPPPRIPQPPSAYHHHHHQNDPVHPRVGTRLASFEHSYYHPAHHAPSLHLSYAPPPRQWRDGKIPLNAEGRWGRAQSSLSSWAASDLDGGGRCACERGGRGRGGSTSSFFASRGRNSWRGGRGDGDGRGAGRGEGGSEYHYDQEAVKAVATTTATMAPTTTPAADPAAVERVQCVMEAMHLVAPFLSPPEGLRMSGVLRSWTRPYREVTRELRVGEPPSGTAMSGHWTSLLNLLASLTNLEILRVTHHRSIFGVTKSLGYGLTQRLTCLELSHAKMWRTDAGRLMDALSQKFFPSLERLLLVDCGLGDRAIEHLAVAVLSGGCRQLCELELGDNSFRGAILDLAVALNSTWAPSAEEDKEGEGGRSGCCPKLKLLGLGGNALQKEGVEWFVEGLSSSEQSQSHADEDGGDAEDSFGMRSAAAAGRSSGLAASPLACLTELNAVECGLELEGLEALCPGLRHGPLSHLTALRLNANRLGDLGMALLASALTKGACPDLEELDLGANYMTDVGLRALLDVVKTRRGLRQLRRLNLSFNFLTPDAGWALLECCDGGEGGREDAGAADGDMDYRAPWACLQHCDLYMNEITAKERAELQVALKERAPALDCFM